MELKQVSTRLPMDLYRRVKVKAAQTDKTMTEAIREALVKWVEDDEPEPPPNGESGQG